MNRCSALSAVLGVAVCAFAPCTLHARPVPGSAASDATPALASEAADRDAWLEASVRALPLRVSVVALTTDRRFRITDDVSRRTPEASRPDRAFAFVPPSGAQDVGLPAPHGARTGE